MEIYNPSAGGSGTVTSVSGTTNQIDVATGTTTAVVSLDAAASNALLPYAADTGTANTYAITVPNIPASIQAGIAVRFKAGNASSGASTLNVTPTGGSAYGAIALMKRTTTSVLALSAGGDITAGGIYEAMYDGTQWVLSTPSSTIYAAGALTANSMVRGNSNNQVATSAGISSSGGIVFTTYNSEGTAGVGLSYMRGSTSQKAESAADTNVLTVTPAASAATYRCSFVIDVSAATAATLGWTMTWKDSNGNAQAPANLALFSSGVAAPVLTLLVAAGGTYYGDTIINVDNSATSIVVKLTFTGTSFTAKATAILERIG